MTDSSPGPDWWLASDGKWYPPHLHPSVRAQPFDARASERGATPEKRDPTADVFGRPSGASTEGDRRIGSTADLFPHATSTARPTGSAPSTPGDFAIPGRPVAGNGPTITAPTQPAPIPTIPPAGADPAEPSPTPSAAAKTPSAPSDLAVPRAALTESVATPTVPATALPQPSPIDAIRAATGGGIDWEAAAQERARLRELRRTETNGRRRQFAALLAGAIALALVVLVARSDRSTDDRKLNTSTTIVSNSSRATGASASGAMASGATATASGATASGATASAVSTTVAPTTTVVATTTTAATTTTTTAAATTAAASGSASVSVFALAPGSCVDQEDLTTGLITTVRTVPCDQPHTHEVYAKATVTPDGAYDAARVSAFANDACTAAFFSYVGIAYDQSKYYFMHLAPSAESWTKSHDRDVVCLLLLQGQRLTASVKGTGQ